MRFYQSNTSLPTNTQKNRVKNMKLFQNKTQKYFFYFFLFLIFLFFIIQIISYLYILTYLWQIRTLTTFFSSSSTSTSLSSSSSSILALQQRNSCLSNYLINNNHQISRNSNQLDTNHSINTLKIGIIVLYSESSHGDWNSDIIKMVLKNRESYAKLYNYKIISNNKIIDKNRPIAWSKILLIQKYLKEFDYLFYIDMDAIIMEPMIKLEDFILLDNQKSDIIMTEDWNGLNTGVWLIKNTKWSEIFLNLIWNQTQLIPPRSLIPPYEKHPFEYEQRAFHYVLNTKIWKNRRNLPRYNEKENDFLGSSQEMLKHITILPQCSMNSYVIHPFDSIFQFTNRRKKSQVMITIMYNNLIIILIFFPIFFIV